MLRLLESPLHLDLTFQKLVSLLHSRPTPFWNYIQTHATTQSIPAWSQTNPAGEHSPLTATDLLSHNETAQLGRSPKPSNDQSCKSRRGLCERTGYRNVGETERRLKSKRSLDYIHNELEKRRKSLRARGDAVAVMNQSSQIGRAHV